MDRKPFAHSIWDLDPRAIKESDYREIEALFLAAFEHAFGLRATKVRVRPYVYRYFRFRVVPPWLRRYVQAELAGEAIDNIGDAPLDPVIDLRPFFWRTALLIHLVLESTDPGNDDASFEA